ncbi:MAG: nitroreductase family protein [Desulfobaccales bacterium]
MQVNRRSSRTRGLIGLALAALMLTLAAADKPGWAQDKPAGEAPAEIKVPKGTLDAVTAILTRRSIRDYTPRPVPEETIKLLLTAGMAAPSAFGERSTEFVVVNDPQLIKEIAKVNPVSVQLKKMTVGIVVCGNQAKEKFKGQGYWQLDGAVASENILVAANALGLGAVWTAIYPYPDRIPKVQKLLNLPAEVIPLNIIPIGFPAERKITGNRFDPARAHTNRW